MTEKEFMIYSLFVCGIVSFLVAVIIILFTIFGIIEKDVWSIISIIALLAAMGVLFGTAVTQPQIK